MRLALKVLQLGRPRNTKAFKAIDVLADDEGLQKEFKAAIRKQYGINPDNLKALLQLFIEYAPQIIELILKLVKK